MRCAPCYPVTQEDLATLSPCHTRHINRFGDYMLTVTTPEPFDEDLTSTAIQRSAEAEVSKA
jgi:hypothetical protein